MLLQAHLAVHNTEVVVQAVDDDHVPLDARIEQALLRRVQQLLRALIIKLEAEGQHQHGVPRGLAPSAEELVAEGFFNVGAVDDPLRRLAAAAAQRRDIAGKIRSAQAALAPLEQMLQAGFHKEQAQQFVRAQGFLFVHGPSSVVSFRRNAIIIAGTRRKSNRG